jgi:hypothetical protein
MTLIANIGQGHKEKVFIGEKLKSQGVCTTHGSLLYKD